MKFIKKSLSAMLILGIMFTVYIPSLVLADSGARFSASVTATSSGGYVNGKSNGRYYTLNAGKASLKNYSYSGSGTIWLTLYRQRTGSDKSYGTKVVGSNALNWSVDTTASNYYFYVYAEASQGSRCTFNISGTLHNHL